MYGDLTVGIINIRGWSNLRFDVGCRSVVTGPHGAMWVCAVRWNLLRTLKHLYLATMARAITMCQVVAKCFALLCP